jgi:DNA-binding LacI/PurR family transcriptional regulator
MAAWRIRDEVHVTAAPTMTTGKRLIGTLRQRIETGVYNRGAPLPSGRQLAQEFQADRATVQRALAALRQQGVVRQVSPRVNVVSEQAAASPSRRLVGQTVALVAISGRRMLASHRQPGWVEYIGLGALPAIEDAGMHALSFHPATLRDEGLSSLIQARPYGVIFSDLLTETGEEQMLAQLDEAGIPYVVYGDIPGLSGCDRVSSDHEHGCYLLTRELIARGRKRILCFWQDGLSAPWLSLRYRGYERAMHEAGLDPLPIADHPAVADGARDQASFERASKTIAGHLAEHLLGDEPADALLLTSDGNVPYAATACRLLRKTPNKDVMLAGYDHYWADVPERAYDHTPPVLTIDKQNMRMGEGLVTLLRQRVAGELPEQPQVRLVTPQLIDLTADALMSSSAA